MEPASEETTNNKGLKPLVTDPLVTDPLVAAPLVMKPLAVEARARGSKPLV